MYKGRDAVRKLLVLKKAEGHIIAASHKIILSNLAMDASDIQQEARLKILEVINHYPDKSIKEVVALSIRSLYNMINENLRISQRFKSYGEVVELTEAFNIHDERWIAETYCNIALHALREMLDKSEKQVFDAMLCTDADVAKFVTLYCEHQNRSVTVTVEAIAAYFGASRFMIYRILDSIKLKVPAALNILPSTT